MRARRIPITIPAIAPGPMPVEEDDWDVRAASVGVEDAAAAVAVDASVATSDGAETDDEVARTGLPSTAVAVSLESTVDAAEVPIRALEICSAIESVVGVALGEELGAALGGLLLLAGARVVKPPTGPVKVGVAVI